MLQIVVSHMMTLEASYTIVIFYDTGQIKNNKAKVNKGKGDIRIQLPVIPTLLQSYLIVAFTINHGQTSANRTKPGLKFQPKKWPLACWAFMVFSSKTAELKVENSAQITSRLSR
jgi:hypothetical protein